MDPLVSSLPAFGGRSPDEAWLAETLPQLFEAPRPSEPWLVPVFLAHTAKEGRKSSISIQQQQQSSGFGQKQSKEAISDEEQLRSLQPLPFTAEEVASVLLATVDVAVSLADTQTKGGSSGSSSRRRQGALLLESVCTVLAAKLRGCGGEGLVELEKVGLRIIELLVASPDIPCPGSFKEVLYAAAGRYDGVAGDLLIDRVLLEPKCLQMLSADEKAALLSPPIQATAAALRATLPHNPAAAAAEGNRITLELLGTPCVEEIPGD